MEITKQMCRIPVWKAVAYGAVCMKEEYETYTKLCKNRYFDRTKEVKKTIDRFFKAAATGYAIDEQFLLHLEQSRFEPQDEWDEMALMIINDSIAFFYAVYEKNIQVCLEIGNRRLDLLNKYTKEAHIEECIRKELETQMEMRSKSLFDEIVSVSNKDKKAYLLLLQEKAVQPIFGQNWTDKLPEREIQKKIKKKSAEIRTYSLNFEKMKNMCDAAWLISSTPKQWVLGRACDEQTGAYYEHYANKQYLDLSYIMKTRYLLLADEDFISNENPDRVRGYWFLVALTSIYVQKLEEKNYPICSESVAYYLKRHHDGDEGFCSTMLSMFCAYASGEIELLKEIAEAAPASEKKKANALKDIFEGNMSGGWTEELEMLDLPEAEGIQHILSKNNTGLHKYILKEIRAMRSAYEMLGETVNPYLYAMIRLGSQYGVPVKNIEAAEVLFGKVYEEPLDKSYWKLPYQQEMENWLQYGNKSF